MIATLAAAHPGAALALAAAHGRAPGAGIELAPVMTSTAGPASAEPESPGPAAPAAPAPEEPSGPGVTVRETAEAARANLTSVLTLVKGGQLKCSATSQRPSEITVQMIADVLAGGDFYEDEPIAAFAWPLLLQSGGLALLDGTKMRPTTRGRTVLAEQDPAALDAALAGLWTRWLTKAPIDELMRIEAIRGQRIPATLTAPTKRRAAVAAGLAALPAEGWIPVDRLLRIVRNQEPALIVPRSEAALWRLYLEDPEFGSLGHPGFGNWDILEGRYALCVVFEYAATLGLLDIAYQHPDDARDDFRDNWGVEDYRYLSRYDGLLAVRRTALGTTVFNPVADDLPVLGP